MGTGTGQASIMASFDDVTQAVLVTVAARVADLSLARDADGSPVEGVLELTQGRASSLRAVPRGPDGTVLQLAVDWSSSNTTVAAVDPQGQVLARAPGTATVRAAAGGVERDVRIRVVAPVTAEATPQPSRPEPITTTETDPVVAQPVTGEPAGMPSAPGVIQLLITNTWAEVYVDGAFHGETDRLPGLPLPAGQHTLRLLRAGHLTWDTTIVLAPGDTARIRTELRPRGEHP